MTIFILERVPAVLRGELSRWLIEPRTGVSVGRLSAMVRERLWRKLRTNSQGGAGMLVFASQTEQGFAIDSFGDTDRKVVDWEGLTLVCVPRSVAMKHSAKRGYEETPVND